MDVAQLQQALVSVEAAANADPSLHAMAEAMLTDFRASPAALQISRYILEHSGQDAARFQAALALREAALQQWPLLPLEARSELRAWLLLYLLRRAGEMTVAVRQLIAVLAVIVKRDWLDQPSTRHSFFQETEAACESQPLARQLQMALFEAIVVEFVPATATVMHLPWDFHCKCSAEFQAQYLLPLFQLGLSVARQCSTAVSNPSSLAATTAAARLLVAILEWDFTTSATDPAYAMWDLGPDSTETVTKVKPPAKWRDTLLAPGAFTWLTELIQRSPAKGGTAAQEDLASAARQLVVRLCGVSGPIFNPPHQPAENGTRHSSDSQMAALEVEATTKAKFLAPLLQEVLRWTAAAEELPHVMCNEAQLLAGAAAIAAAAVTHQAQGFNAACPPGGAVPAGAIASLAGITVGLINKGGMSDEQRGEPIGEATELLLEAWRDLVSMGSPVDQSTATAATEVFAAICTCSLQEMADGAFQDAEDEATEQAQEALQAAALERACSLGRVAPHVTLPLMTHHLEQHRSALSRAPRGGAEAAVVLEQLWWLVRMAVALVADQATGETASPPEEVTAAATEVALHGGRDPLAAMSQALLDVCGLLLEPSAHVTVSPRLMEAALESAAVWAKTYLLPEPCVTPQARPSAEMHNLFGDTAQGASTVNRLVQVAVAALEWTGEVALHRVAITKLLSVLASSRTALATALLRSQSWQSLLGFVGAYSSGVRHLDVPLQGSLFKVALMAAKFMSDVSQADGYARFVLHTVIAVLASLAERMQKGTQEEANSNQGSVVALCEILRGACQATASATRPAIWAAMSASLSPLLALAPQLRTLDASHRLFKTAAAIVEYHGDYLKAPEQARLCSWAVALLRDHASAKSGAVSIAGSSPLRHQFVLQQGRELQALLQLLTSLALLDGAISQWQKPTGAMQAVLSGVELVVPDLSDEQLAVPKTARRWFGLLAFLLVTCPALIANLPGELFGKLMEGLQKGLASLDMEVGSECTNALSSLASFHHSETSQGRPGLGAHNAPGNDGRTLLGRFLEDMLRRVLLEDDSCDRADRSSSALLALLLSEPATFKALGEGLVAQQQDPSLANQLAKELQSLLKPDNGTYWSLTREHKRAFAAVLRGFLSKARCMIRRK